MIRLEHVFTLCCLLCLLHVELCQEQVATWHVAEKA